MPWDMTKAETNKPFTPAGIRVWHNHTGGLYALSDKKPDNMQESQEFKESMFKASDGIKRANKERLERTKKLANARKHGADGQTRF